MKHTPTRYIRTGCGDHECMCGGTMEPDHEGSWVEWDEVSLAANYHDRLLEALKAFTELSGLPSRIRAEETALMLLAEIEKEAAK